MKYYDHQMNNVLFYELELTNKVISEQKGIRAVFENVDCLFNKCFAKKQNYSLEACGKIVIHYKI